MPQTLVQRRIHQKRKEKNAHTHIHTETDNTLSGGGKTQKEIRGNREHNQTNPTQQRGGASEPATESEAKGKRPGEVGERRRGVGGGRDDQQEQQGATARTGRQLGLHIRVQK